MWDIKQKATKQTNKKSQITDNRMVVTRGKGGQWEEDEKVKGSRIYGGGRRLDFGWWAHNRVYRRCIIKLYNWNICNVINQCFPIKFNLVYIKNNVCVCV